MKNREWTTLPNKQHLWGDGPWVGEPDKVQWMDTDTGYPCLMVRNTHVTGNWCGYVGLPRLHPYYGVHYDKMKPTNGGGDYIEVHGGLTFSGACHPRENEAEGICHVPDAGESDKIWWAGFDTGHCMDVSPMMDATIRKVHADKGIPRENYRLAESEYRDMNYTKAQVMGLAQQLKDVEDASHELLFFRHLWAFIMDMYAPIRPFVERLQRRRHFWNMRLWMWRNDREKAMLPVREAYEKICEKHNLIGIIRFMVWTQTVGRATVREFFRPVMDAWHNKRMKR